MCVTRATVCEMCPRGTYSSRGSASCTDCPTGTYNDQEQQAACTNCAQNTYMEFLGKTTCYTCPLQSTTSGTGANSVANCTCQGGKSMSSDRACVNYWRTGVVHNVPEQDLLSGGWTKCPLSKLYSDQTLTRQDLMCGKTKSQIESGMRFAFGAKRTGSTTIEILAMGSSQVSTGPIPVFPLPLTGARNESNPRIDAAGNLRSDPFQENAFQAVPKLENGVYWYITAAAFGFSANAQVILNDQDSALSQCEDRLGWAFSGPGHRVGCRCSGGSSVPSQQKASGCSEDIVFSEWERIMYWLA